MRKLVVGVAGVVLVSCGVFGSTDEEAPPPGPEPSVAAPGQPAPPVDGAPIEDQLTEKFGVFVSPTGAQDGDGTRAKPLATIAAGLERAIAERKRLYVCTGTFKEPVKVVKGIAIIGGLDCSRPDWKPSGGRTTIASPTSPAVIAEDIDVATRLDALEIVAPDGTDADPNSIGLRAKAATALVLANSKIRAGKGKDGADGADGPQLALGASAKGGDSLAQENHPPSFYVLGLLYRDGAAGGVGSCTGAPGVQAGGNGGAGGKGGSYDTEAQSPPGGLSGQYFVLYCRPAGNVCVKDWVPTAGASMPGTVGTPGTDGASALAAGTLNADGYTPANGSAGTNGGAGAGGSGGQGGALSGYAGSTQQWGYGATGPGGGAGGCPGLAGTPGRGGGASIGALLVSSKGIVFDATEITASAGGAGGKGSFGSSPTPGGAPGTKSGSAGNASAGGAGGRSGVSGSGAGGPSYGIAATLGDAKLENGAVAKAGLPGAGVPELTTTDAVGNAKTIPASVAGEAKDELSF